MTSPMKGIPKQNTYHVVYYMVLVRKKFLGMEEHVTCFATWWNKWHVKSINNAYVLFILIKTKFVLARNLFTCSQRKAPQLSIMIIYNRTLPVLIQWI